MGRKCKGPIYTLSEMLWAIPQMVKVIASWSTGLWHQALWWASEKGSLAHPFKAELGVGTSLQEMFTSPELPERRRSVFHYYWIILYPSFQMPLQTFTINAFHCCWVTKSCPNLCNSMDCSTPGSHVFHYLLKFAQTWVHWVNNAIQPSHPLSSPSPPALNLPQHQGLCQWVRFSHQAA